MATRREQAAELCSMMANGWASAGRGLWSDVESADDNAVATLATRALNAAFTRTAPIKSWAEPWAEAEAMLRNGEI